MPDPKDVLKNLASSKDQLAQISQMADGIKSGALPPSDATKAAAALKDEAMKKMPAPVGAAKDALTGLGQQVGAAGAPIPDIAGSLPAMSAPISAATGSLGDLTKKVPSAETLQASIPDVQEKLAPLQAQI